MVRSHSRGVCVRRAYLSVELLEDRNLLATGLGSLVAEQSLPADPNAYDPSDILVQLQPGYTNSARFSLTGAETGTPSAIASGLWKIELNNGVTVADALAIFRSDPRVQSDQPDYRISVETTPNDPYFTSNMLWGLQKINAPAAWNHTTGSGNVIVAVIDTGIDYNHQDLQGNIWTNPGNVAGDGIGNDYHGANFTSLTMTTGNVLDDNGHGSHVAGIIGAVGNNGTGVVGVNWRVQLMALKFLDANGSGYTSGAVRAIDYAIAHGASIINASWGGGGFDQALSDAIGRARQAGIIFVAAAGNSGTNNDTTPFYPAGYNSDNVVTVAASDQTDQRAWFSNYGPHSVDLYAPGVGIWSTTPNNTYSSYSGTSMATPYVTGALTLLKAEHPGWNYHQLIARLQATVDKLPQFSNVLWGGRLDVGAALADPPPVSTTHPEIIGTIASKPSKGQFYNLRLIFNESIDPTSFTASDVTLTGPNGPIAVSSVTAVAGSNNTQFDVSFPTQTTPGTYYLSVGPHIKDASGNEMTAPFITSFTVKSVTTTIALNSGLVNLPIQDFHTTTSTLNVAQALNISKLTLSININHTWDGDLYIRLRGPDGTTIVLYNRRGGSGHNIRATFDDTAATPIGAGKAPFTGSFRPERALSAFTGKNAKGAWQLIVQDKAAGDQGTLLNWSLTIHGTAVDASAHSHASSADKANGSATTTSAKEMVDSVFAHPLLEWLQAPANREVTATGQITGSDDDFQDHDFASSSALRFSTDSVIPAITEDAAALISLAWSSPAQRGATADEVFAEGLREFETI
jgi:subtilisin family serine protease/subtilisin-like proprotein convertase family protein